LPHLQRVLLALLLEQSLPVAKIDALVLRAAQLWEMGEALPLPALKEQEVERTPLGEASAVF